MTQISGASRGQPYYLTLACCEVWSLRIVNLLITQEKSDAPTS